MTNLPETSAFAETVDLLAALGDWLRPAAPPFPAIRPARP